MASYERYFNFRRPYQILLDDEFAFNLHRAKLSPQKQLDMCMRSETKLMITQCAMHSLYLKGSEHQPVVDLAKTFERRKCNHKEAIPVHECMASVVGPSNKHRYVVATTNPKLRKQLHTVPGTPIVHYNRMVLVLEPPSEVTTQRINKIEGEKVSQSVIEKRELKEMARADEGSESESKEDKQQPVKKKRKGPKGPNPLSAKKKKTQSQPSSSDKKEHREQQQQQQQQQQQPREQTEQPKKKKSRRRKHGGSSGGAGAEGESITAAPSAE